MEESLMSKELLLFQLKRSPRLSSIGKRKESVFCAIRRLQYTQQKIDKAVILINRKKCLNFQISCGEVEVCAIGYKFFKACLIISSKESVSLADSETFFTAVSAIDFAIPNPIKAFAASFSRRA